MYYFTKHFQYFPTLGLAEMDKNLPHLCQNMDIPWMTKVKSHFELCSVDILS